MTVHSVVLQVKESDLFVLTVSSIVALSTADATVDEGISVMLVFLLQKKQELQMYCLERDNGKVETVHFIVAQISWEWVHVVTLSDISLHATLKLKIETNTNWYTSN